MAETSSDDQSLLPVEAPSRGVRNLEPIQSSSISGCIESGVFGHSNAERGAMHGRYTVSSKAMTRRLCTLQKGCRFYDGGDSPPTI
jgi:hypothetical protein